MEHVVRYRRESSAARHAGLFFAFLAASIAASRPEEQSSPEVPLTGLFRGEIAQPLMFRNALTTLRSVVDARFYRPDWWRYLDPVMTVGGEVLRMECFSSCASVYARTDFLPDAFTDGAFAPSGTTNVDFGTGFMRNLATMRPNEPSRFEVAEDSVTLTTARGATIERKVKLPERWVKGFLQVQAVQRRMTPVFDLDRVLARQLVAAIPASARNEMFVVRKANRVEVLPRRPITGESAVGVADLNRLRLLTTFAPDIRSLRVFSQPETGASVWIADAGAVRLTLGLSSQAANGFSGDGDALRCLAEPEADDVAVRLADATAARLGTFSVEEFAEAEDATPARAAELIDRLSAHGFIGYDRDRDLCFRRVLPFLADKKSQPGRVAGSRDLLENERVEITERTPRDDGSFAATGFVEGLSATYRARIEIAPDGYLRDGTCTCAWIQKHGLKRGPCKHLLALRFACERGGTPSVG